MIADDLAGRNAADRDLALPGAEVLDGEAGDVRRDVLERLGTAIAELRLGRRGHGDRHILDRLLALARGDDHLLGHLRLLLFLRGGLVVFFRRRLLTEERQGGHREDEDGDEQYGSSHEGLHGLGSPFSFPFVYG